MTPEGLAVDDLGHAVDLTAWPVVPLVDALRASYDTDAHLAPYVLLGADGRPSTAQPRVNKDALPHLLSRGLRVDGTVWCADLDLPGHDPWVTPEAAQQAVSQLSRALPGLGVYATSRGARIVAPLPYSMPVGELYEASLRGWLASLAPIAAPTGLTVDMTCGQWNRLFRLPHVQRDGQAYLPPAIAYPADRLDLRNVRPVFPVSAPALPSHAGTREPQIARAVQYAQHATPAIQGKYGSTQTLKVAIALVKGFSVPPEAAVQILAEHYNPRCEPPWSDKDLVRKVSQATKARVPDGYMDRQRVRCTRDMLREAATQWSRTQPALSRALRSITRGDQFDQGLAEQLVKTLLFSMPELDPKSLAEHFQASLAIMPEAHLDIQAIASRWADLAPPPYAPGSEFGKADEALILVSPVGNTIYLRAADDWLGPLQGQDAPDVAISHTLAEHLELFTPEGKPKSKKALIREYGHVISEHKIILGATRSRYDPATNTFEEACARPRILPEDAQYSESVDRFLRGLASDSYRDVQTWLSVLPDLSQTLASLVLIGPRGVGKSLFAAAAARLWSDRGPSRAVEVFSDWTGSLLQCPLTFADEYLPKGLGMSGKIREFVASYSLNVTRKFLPSTEAVGCPRLIIAGNNSNILTFGESLNPDDLSAIAERFYLVNIGRTDIDGETANRFVHQDELARHAMWLNLNLARQRRSRFWVKGMPLDLLALQGGARSEVCRWISNWLDNPSKFNIAMGGRADSQHALHTLMLQEIFQAWSVYVDTPRPSLADLRVALSIVADPTRLPNHKRGWRVRIEKIDAWRDFFC